MAQSKYLKQNGETIYPYTIMDNIFDSQTGDLYSSVLEDKFDAILDHNGQKNLATAITTTRTNGGITFTPQIDGSVSVIGTSSAEAWSNWSVVTLNSSTYIISGSSNNTAIELWSDDGNTLVASSMDGQETTFTVASTASYHLYVEVPSGKTVNTIVYPMIRDARITSNTFIPWYASRMFIQEGITLTVSSGYATFNYPAGINNNDYFMPIIQSRYTSSSLLGWTGTTQKHGDTSCYIYVRQGTTQPSNNTTITFDAIFIHR